MNGTNTEELEIDFDAVDNVVVDLAQNFKKVNNSLNEIIGSFKAMKNALNSNALDPTINQAVKACNNRITKNENKSKRIQSAINADTIDILIAGQKQSQELAQKVSELEKAMEEQGKFNENISKSVNDNTTAIGNGQAPSNSNQSSSAQSVTVTSADELASKLPDGWSVEKRANGGYQVNRADGTSAVISQYDSTYHKGTETQYYTDAFTGALSDAQKHDPTTMLKNAMSVDDINAQLVDGYKATLRTDNGNYTLTDSSGKTIISDITSLQNYVSDKKVSDLSEAQWLSTAFGNYLKK